MANKAVFLDRDNTLIHDPGFLSDPEAVRLLPGADMALKSLAQAGYKVVVVTNQSGVARGLLTEETLQRIHQEMQRQLEEKGARIDGTYYCPFHPEGTVEAYAKDSDLRKPAPGMLVKAAHDLDIDLPSSWMVGDSPRDIEAGQRAGCRTIRIRVPDAKPHPGHEEDEDVQADFTLRNLVEAARLILREDARGTGAAHENTEDDDGPERRAEATGAREVEPGSDDRQVQLQILHLLQRLVYQHGPQGFSLSRLAGSVAQGLALVVLIAAVANRMMGASLYDTIVWLLVAVVLQVMAATFWVIRRNP
jgi:D-glycero-D-manno-heptose 1,7-bisphosphate phosphatase